MKRNTSELKLTELELELINKLEDIRGSKKLEKFIQNTDINARNRGALFLDRFKSNGSALKKFHDKGYTSVDQMGDLVRDDVHSTR